MPPKHALESPSAPAKKKLLLGSSGKVKSKPAAKASSDLPPDPRQELHERAKRRVNQTGQVLKALLGDLEELQEGEAEDTIRRLREENEALKRQLNDSQIEVMVARYQSGATDPGSGSTKEEDKNTRRKIKRGYVGMRETFTRILNEYYDIDITPPPPEPITEERKKEMATMDQWPHMPLEWFAGSSQWPLLCREDRLNRALEFIHELMHHQIFSENWFGLYDHEHPNRRIKINLEKNFDYFENLLRSKGAPPGSIKDWVRATILATETITPDALVELRRKFSDDVSEHLFNQFEPILKPAKDESEAELNKYQESRENVKKEWKSICIAAIKFCLRMRKARDLYKCVLVTDWTKPEKLPFEIGEGIIPVSVLGGRPEEERGEKIAYGVWGALIMQKRSPGGATFNEKVHILERARVVMDVREGVERPYPEYKPPEN